MADERMVRSAPEFVPRFLIPKTVLQASEAFLRERGEHEYEGTALWTGRPAADGWVEIARLIVPEQVAQTSEFGCHVELTAEAHYTLPDLLEPGELYYARIHSHPDRAYHSKTDDTNQVITQEGAISVVVPNFARERLELVSCAIYFLEHGRGWRRLAPTDIRDRFRIVENTVR
jgi:hypothetical protein